MSNLNKEIEITPFCNSTDEVKLTASDLGSDFLNSIPSTTVQQDCNDESNCAGNSLKFCDKYLDEDKTDFLEQEFKSVVFLNNVNEEELLLTFFDEELETNDEQTGKKVGSYKISVQRTKRKGEDQICIKINNMSINLDGTESKNDLTCYLDYESLSLLEQEHTFKIKRKRYSMEKIVKIKFDSESKVLDLNRETRENGVLKKARWKHTIDDIHTIVTEGSSVLLQRLMVRFQIHYNTAFKRIDAKTGKLCRVLYKPLPKRKHLIDNQNILVCGIERDVAVPKDSEELPLMWQTYFMPDGHITALIQVGSPLVSKVQTVPELIEKFFPDAKPTFAKKPLLIDDDMEMTSRFLDRKQELEADHQTYLRHHPEVKDILSDFFQHCLIHKPEDVVQEAARYFSKFSPHVVIPNGGDVIKVDAGEGMQPKFAVTERTSDGQLPSYPLAQN